MDIMQILATLKPVLEIIITIILGIAARALTKHLGIVLAQQDIDAIKAAILNLVTTAEARYSDKSGPVRKQIVCDQVLSAFNDTTDNVFTDKRKSLLSKVFGTVNFIAPLVETVFQASSLAKKHK